MRATDEGWKVQTNPLSVTPFPPQKKVDQLNEVRRIIGTDKIGSCFDLTFFLSFFG